MKAYSFNTLMKGMMFISMMAFSINGFSASVNKNNKYGKGNSNTVVVVNNKSDYNKGKGNNAGYGYGNDYNYNNYGNAGNIGMAGGKKGHDHGDLKYGDKGFNAKYFEKNSAKFKKHHDKHGNTYYYDKHNKKYYNAYGKEVIIKIGGITIILN